MHPIYRIKHKGDPSRIIYTYNFVYNIKDKDITFIYPYAFIFCMKEKKRRWYELDFGEALFNGYEKFEKAEKTILRTSAMIPQMVRIAISNLKADWNNQYSQRYITYQLINHGHAILQHKHSKAIKKAGEMRMELKYPKIKRVRNFMYELKTTVDGMDTPARREVRIPKHVVESMGNIAEILSIEQSSLVRLFMYYSLATAKVFVDMKEGAYREIGVFENYLEESEAIYEGLALAEKRIEEKRRLGGKNG